MFGIFTSEQSKARHDAKNWLHLADKVVHFRRDELPAQELQDILRTANDLKNRLAEKADAARLKMAIERLEGCLRRSGGTHYPKSGWADNLEFILVAAILFLGIRAFFVQPFKIPTNSMWPTYYGMTDDTYVSREDEPGKIAQLARLAAFGASAYRLDAPADGELHIALPYVAGGAQLARPVKGRRLGVLPSQRLECIFVVGDQAVSISVPADFDLKRVLGAALSHEANGDSPHLFNPTRGTDRFITTKHGGGQMRIVPTGRQVKKGERIVSFDILTGDQLFVDRMSYHFVPPSVGDAFVFRTIHIKGIDGGRNSEAYADRYYIKRLVGGPNDVLEVKSPELWRNGAPITGSEVFEKNAAKEDRYPGYTYQERLMPGSTVTIPTGSFFAMGDNSPNSSDSRVWGFVPAGDVVGRPLFIYYPFTARWGPAR